MSKIIIEDGLSLYKKTGIGQYSQNLFNILSEMGYKVEMRRKPFLERIKNSTLKRILYILWLNLIFPFIILFKNTDKIIFTNTITPVFKLPLKKYYPVLHDLWAYKVPDTISFVQSLYIRFVMFSMKNTYEKIITVSETVKTEIIEFLKCSIDDVEVIYNTFSFGENPIIQQTQEEQYRILAQYNIEPKKYILSVATLNKRKNIPMLIDAFLQIETDIKLVLVGEPNNERFGSVNNKNIIFTGYIEDDLLKILYKNALIYVFPSVYEGFGIPIIDAQAFGIPVLCSDIPVFKEIAGEGALYFSLTDENLQECLKTILLDDNIMNSNKIEISERRQRILKKAKENIIRYNDINIRKQIEGFLL